MKISDSPSIFVQVPRGPALVSAVKKWNESPLFHHSAYYLPLVLAWICSCWIVGLGMQNKDGSLRTCPHAAKQTLEVKLVVLVIPVWIGTHIREACLKKYVSVIDPGGIRVSSRDTSKLLPQEIRPQSQRPCSSNALDWEGSARADSFTAAEQQLDDSCVGPTASEGWQIFMIVVSFRQQDSLNFSHYRENVGLASLILRIEISTF